MEHNPYYIAYGSNLNIRQMEEEYQTMNLYLKLWEYVPMQQ